MKFTVKKKPTKFNKNQVHLFFIFSVLFFTQLSSFTHKIQHVDNNADIRCLICINAPDVLTDPSFKFVITPLNKPTAINFTQLELIIKDSFTPYSIRAPPIFT